MLFGGPTVAHVLRALSRTTGRAPMPPLWAQGYHQSHWNLKSQAQVAALDRNFDRHGVPLDAAWLDIEHTISKRYFTWDPQARTLECACARVCARACVRARVCARVCACARSRACVLPSA